MKLNRDSDNEGLNRLLGPIHNYYEWSPEEVTEYLVFVDEIDFEIADDYLKYYPGDEINASKG